ncbi:hypothetical protein MKX01_009179 [Papaver californicum]|nr:hypothetical protein MKX01_009179 [Papaver californicum]
MDGQGGGGEVVRIPKDKKNNQMMISQLQSISRKLTELGNGYGNWVSKQSFPVEATAVAGHVFPKHSLAIKAKFASPMAEARLFAALQCKHASIVCIMKRIKGKGDVQTRIAAGFGAGAMSRLVTRNPLSILMCSSRCSIVFQLDKKNSQLQLEYTRTKCMLSNLGLQNYEKNFEKGLLTDYITIPLLTGSILTEVGVPPRPRLIILNHIEKDPELQKMRQGLSNQV